MPKRTDTYDLAYRACSELFGETGKPPTIASVKDRIAVNSPVTIKKAIDDWLIHLAADFINRRKNPGIPENLFDTISSLWKSALSEAEKTLDKKSKELTEREQESNERVKKAEDQLEAALQENNQLSVRFKDQEQYTLHFKEEIKALRTEQVTALEDATIARQELEKSTHQCANLQAKYGEAQRQWDERFENEHDWMLRRIQEEKDRIEQVEKQEKYRLKSEIEGLKLDKTTWGTRLSQAQSLADKLLEKNDTLSQSIIRLEEKIEKQVVHSEGQEELIDSLKKQLIKIKNAASKRKKQTLPQKPRQLAKSKTGSKRQ